MKYLNRFSIKVTTLVLAILYILSSAPTYAISQAQLNFYGKNNIFFYNPDGDACTTVSLGSYSGTPSTGATPEMGDFIDTYHDLAVKLSIEFGVPWEIAIAQGIKESNSGTSPMAVTKNNFHGINAPTTNTGGAWAYATPTDGWIGYYYNLAGTHYRPHGLFTGDNITNPFSAAQIIGPVYAEDPNYTRSLINTYIPIVIKRAEDKGWPTTADLAKSNPIMYENAARIYAGGSASAPYNRSGSGTLSSPFKFSSNGVSGNNGNAGNPGGGNTSGGVCASYGQGNGNINQTALSLAWPNYGVHDKYDPKPEYQVALQYIGVSNNSDKNIRLGASCDIFVAAVMRYSGVDRNFPLYLGQQKSYIPSHPELYKYIGVATDTNLVQPGDIRISNSHIELVVRRSDGSLGIASASHGDRTAETANFYNDASFKIYRHI